MKTQDHDHDDTKKTQDHDHDDDAKKTQRHDHDDDDIVLVSREGMHDLQILLGDAVEFVEVTMKIKKTTKDTTTTAETTTSDTTRTEEPTTKTNDDV